MVYKVIFKGKNEQNDELLSLTFRHINSENFIKIPSYFLNSLKTLSSQNENIINFQNIDEVIKSDDVRLKSSINYYIVLLINPKSSNIKQGFLIGNLKKLGDVVIGLWPYNSEDLTKSSEDVYFLLNDIIENTDNYEKISVIYS